MDMYMSVLYNMGTSTRRSRGALVFGRRESSMLESSSPTNVDVDNEAAVRRTIQKISMGDFAHLPPTSVLKGLFQSEKHKTMLQRAYRNLSLTHLSIDGTAARVLSMIILSPQCRCRCVRIHRCAFTEQGRNILFSALSVAAAAATATTTTTSVSMTTQPHAAVSKYSANSDETELACKAHYCAENRQESTSPVEKNGHLAMGLLELDYTEVGISDRTHFTLGDVLLLQPLLQALNVSNNAIGPKSTARLIKAVSSGCPSLRVLNLSGNLLRSEGAQIIAHYLAAEGRNLESLDISSNEIPPTGAAALASSLSALSGCRLKALNVDMNQFEVNGCEALAHALAENKYLETLVISRNNIFDNGCGLLFDGLKSNNTLLRLDVSGNFLTHLSARSFASYMDSRNRASDREFQGSFMRMGIRTLNISANALRDEGITALCAGLQNNAHLMHLLADNVEVADPGMESIRQLLETTSTSRTSLLTLSLLQNRHATRVGFEALGEGCQKNSLILRVSVDPGFDEWSAAWDKGMVAFINNTMRAVDRYRVPLLMVARGHLLLYKYSKQRVASAGPSSIQRLPEEVRWIILSALDTYGVLTAKQRRMALKIASTMSGGYPSKKALLAAILGADYRFVAETMKTLNSL